MFLLEIHHGILVQIHIDPQFLEFHPLPFGIIKPGLAWDLYHFVDDGFSQNRFFYASSLIYWDVMGIRWKYINYLKLSP